MRNGAYVELVRSLYTTLTPTTIMSIGFVLSFSAMAYATHDLVLGICALVGILSSTARIAILLHGRREAAGPDLHIQRARSLERHFAIAYYQFAAVLGVSATYVFTLEPAHLHMLTVCMLVGYGAARQRASDLGRGSPSRAWWSPSCLPPSPRRFAGIPFIG